jgi:hypothetical protein
LTILIQYNIFIGGDLLSVVLSVIFTDGGDRKEAQWNVLLTRKPMLWLNASSVGEAALYSSCEVSGLQEEIAHAQRSTVGVWLP